jgi:YesN/AraC family two-component response regulator
LTDLIMPGPSGVELADRLRLDRPNLRVLYMSGYTDNAIVRNGMLGESAAFLQKPFTPEELLRKLRQVVES